MNESGEATESPRPMAAYLITGPLDMGIFAGDKKEISLLATSKYLPAPGWLKCAQTMFPDESIGSPNSSESKTESN